MQQPDHSPLLYPHSFPSQQSKLVLGDADSPLPSCPIVTVPLLAVYSDETMGIFGLISVLFIVHETTSLIRPNTRTHLHPASPTAAPATATSKRRRRDLCILYSQLSQKQIAQDIRERYLEPLLQEAGIPLDENVAVEKLSDLGFANNVFRVIVKPSASRNEFTTHRHVHHPQQEEPPENQILVAKIFSDLAKQRVDPKQSYMGEVDELLHRHGLGPRVVAHTPDALLMEYIDGQVLTESLIFDETNGKGLSICGAVGDCLSHMHSLPGKGGPNMLWHAMDVLLSSVDKNYQLSTDSGSSWSLAKLQDTIGNYRGRLEAMDVPCVAVGHGDFKLSNVMITHATQEIQFIDFELSGTHYRGYDLAKFFRSAKQSTASRSLYQQTFWESYHRNIAVTGGEDPSSITKAAMDDAVSQLEWEAQLLEPMTWLEAASFFLSMASLDDPSEKEKWNAMARSRLSSFEKMKLAVNEL